MARLPRGTWFGVGKRRRFGRKPRVTTPYYFYSWKGRYPFGCRGNSRHHGLDVGNVTGMPVFAWGNGYVISGGYDPGGYHRWIQVYFPSINHTLTLGHLLNGSQLRVGTRFRKGQRLGRVGTRREGINHPHCHFRAAHGRWVRCIPPCADISPAIVFRKLN